MMDQAYLWTSWTVAATEVLADPLLGWRLWAAAGFKTAPYEQHL